MSKIDFYQKYVYSLHTNPHHTKKPTFDIEQQLHYIDIEVDNQIRAYYLEGDQAVSGPVTVHSLGILPQFYSYPTDDHSSSLYLEHFKPKLNNVGSNATNRFILMINTDRYEIHSLDDDIYAHFSTRSTLRDRIVTKSIIESTKINRYQSKLYNIPLIEPSNLLALTNELTRTLEEFLPRTT